MADQDETEDDILGIIAIAIKGAGVDFPDAAQRDVPEGRNGGSLSAYLRSNQVSDHLAAAVLAQLRRHNYEFKNAPRA
jgi:hypothetical protein